TDGEGDEDLLGGATHHIEHGSAPVLRGGDIQEGQFIRALLAVPLGQLHRITGIAEVLKVDALDHATVVHVQAGDNPDCHTHVIALFLLDFSLDFSSGDPCSRLPRPCLPAPGPTRTSIYDPCSARTFSILSTNTAWAFAVPAMTPLPGAQSLPSVSVTTPPAARTSMTPAALSHTCGLKDTQVPKIPSAVNARSTPMEPVIRGRR